MYVLHTRQYLPLFVGNVPSRPHVVLSHSHRPTEEVIAITLVHSGAVIPSILLNGEASLFITQCV